MNSHHELEAQSETKRLEKEVNRLRRLLMIRRLNVSESSQDLIDYCLNNAQHDAFLTKIPSSKNPFRETGGLTLKNCSLL